MEVVERDEAGHLIRTKVANARIVSKSHSAGSTMSSASLLNFIGKVFLPTGYPRSVAPDYLRYQILNSLQAFCSSLAALLASRATLEGYGVGNASASATNALLLTVLQDIFGRLTTIIAAYFYGSSLFPEAKTYRFLADVLNDAAITIDVLSPLFATLYDAYVPISLPFLPPRVPLRVYTLCLSASLRALCGISAGGPKTAITMHFATPLEGTGDVGDLNAKDSSKETVLSLLGMLIGTVTVPYLTTSWSTYTVLFLMVFFHLFFNYLAVRGVIFRSLNRQRANLAWMRFRHNKLTGNSPTEIADLERILERADAIRSFPSGKTIGRCSMGTSVAACCPRPEEVHLFRDKRYLLCLDRKSSLTRGSIPHFHVLLKEGYSSADQLQAWLLACDIVCAVHSSSSTKNVTYTGLVQSALASFDDNYSGFSKAMVKHGWMVAVDESPRSEEAEQHTQSDTRTLSFTTEPPQSVIIDLLYDGEEGRKEQ